MSTVKAAPHVVPPFYACYLLRSLKPGKKNRTYVGSTPDPARRLRQHNGELTAGARKTARYRPWEMVCIVHGFPSQLAALQFEWAWQNPHLSRQMPQDTKDVLHRTAQDRDTSPGQSRRGRLKRKPTAAEKEAEEDRETGVADDTGDPAVTDLSLPAAAQTTAPHKRRRGKLANMHSMLALDAWRRWPLRVKVFSQDVWDIWQAYVAKPTTPALAPWTTAELDLARPVDPKPHASPPQADPTVDFSSAAPISPAKRAPKKAKKAKVSAIAEQATTGGIQNLDLKDDKLRDLQQAKLEDLASLDHNPACGVCADTVDDTSPHRHTVVCSYLDCRAVFHSSCLAARFLEAEKDRASTTTRTSSPAILPTAGSCPSCQRELSWSELVKGTQYRHLLRTRGCVDVDVELAGQAVDEFADLEHDGSTSGSTASSDAEEGSHDSDSSGSVLDLVSPRQEPMPSAAKRPRGRPRKTQPGSQSRPADDTTVVVVSD